MLRVFNTFVTPFFSRVKNARGEQRCENQSAECAGIRASAPFSCHSSPFFSQLEVIAEIVDQNRSIFIR